LNIDPTQLKHLTHSWRSWKSQVVAINHFTFFDLWVEPALYRWARGAEARCAQGTPVLLNVSAPVDRRARSPQSTRQARRNGTGGNQQATAASASLLRQTKTKAGTPFQPPSLSWRHQFFTPKSTSSHKS
jgi:hypothetical protein